MYVVTKYQAQKTLQVATLTSYFSLILDYIKGHGHSAQSWLMFKHKLSNKLPYIFIVYLFIALKLCIVKVTEK